jgi:C1A family cysteine protease
MIFPTFFKKNLFFLLIISFLISCTSSFDFDKKGIINPKPPVVDPFDDNNLDDPESFGLFNSYCYGSIAPTGDIAEIDIDIVFSESIDLSVFLPEVGSQGNQGSCVAWATGYYLKSFQENMEDLSNGLTGNKNQMSPAFIYNQIKVGSCADGSVIPDALDLISSTGIVTWQEMPYSQNECDIQPTSEQKDLAEENKIISFASLDGDLLFEQAKAFLMNNQPIVIAISIDKDFFGKIDQKGDAVYREFEKEDGAHAILVVGYDDSKNAFKAVNSWGRNWGNNGFVWIDYTAFQEVLNIDSDFKILCEAWISMDNIQ